ncbi:DODA-type extradiol aromatic ring-opening family dioxygenase [Phytohabitans kaempferiae]|uniref:Extradiol ring-cleavage dioxygenase class III enzyme subunit B domain-containing protein n=1 Tax=Phytohabitans kaempferiae TaxID=1620943 RepID=A0ABV6LZ84_9ACTN
MGTLAYAGATSHVGKIARDPHATPEVSDGLHAAWDTMRDDLYGREVDALIVVATDHYETFGLHNYPSFCLGVSDSYEAWGEFGNPTGTVAGHAALSEALLEGLVSRGFDLSRSFDMRLDHSFVVPLTKLLRTPPIPVIPLFVNCNTPPLPSLSRCFALGGAIADVVERLPGDTRVAVVGTGGISHWVGLPRAGQINEEFDRRFLELIGATQLDEVLSWSDEWINEYAGNGALEIRTWMVAHGAARSAPATVLAYAPMHPWHTGIGIVRYEIGVPA